MKMFLLLSIITICITALIVINSLQKNPITIVIHKKLEEIRPDPAPMTEEEKKAVEEQQQFTDGMNEVIRFAQEFLGGDIDAESERKAE